MADAALERLAGVDAVVITIRGRGLAQHQLAVTDPWGRRVEELQYTTGEGPSVTAFTTGDPVLVTNLTEHGARWPGFTDAAGAIGVAAVFAFPLRTAVANLGTMTFYRRSPGALSRSMLADARELADVAAVVLLANSRTEVVEHINSSTDHDAVNIATGLLAAQQVISTDSALAQLRATAFATNRPLAEVAHDVLARHLHDR
ncbi:GAF and ANTAR domain-containing protein [Saccharothrix sp. S26]|uniref:GAF and ANTAR domain-containing protein n=1 Tax=Saccharothrix sp. S26 TaxID=2907215 RepID=UPI001F2D2EB6|nr:GAF and ANTAR domain-containing protein [Saccharothrix sp. S26]MCE6995440.1 GAF and ANTAR domain-containing protein [Saccharothrix sp. S26]